jgi:DNA-binding transcriptional LysR family regulator
MDRFENARVFAAVIEGGGFTRAAERLGLSRAATSKHVLQLEQRLGARLLDRTTRRVSVTAAGRTFYEQCRRILADLDEAERTAGELHNEPRGELRVIAPTNFGLTEIGTAITDFLVAYPQLRINLTLNDHLTDPIEGGYDVAISVDMPRGASTSLVVPRGNMCTGAARPKRPKTSQRTIVLATATWPRPASGILPAPTANGW